MFSKLLKMVLVIAGHDGQKEEEMVSEEKSAANIDNADTEEHDRIEGDEEDEEEGWDSDEFESENDSDDRDEHLPDKRASKIIFDELHDIPDLVRAVRNPR